MLNSIPVNRAVIYAVCAGLLPVIFVLFLFFTEKGKIEDLHMTLENIRHQALLKEKKQALNVAVRQHFREADHFYIDKHIETATFLEPEIEVLQKINTDKSFSDDDRVKKRLDFLTGAGNMPGNQLVFSEGVVQSFPLFQETVETLVHPVEVSAADLQTILARIEGVEMGKVAPGPNRPQLFITDFKMDKKAVYEQNEVYVLNIKLVKREFL